MKWHAFKLSSAILFWAMTASCGIFKYNSYQEGGTVSTSPTPPYSSSGSTCEADGNGVGLTEEPGDPSGYSLVCQDIAPDDQYTCQEQKKWGKCDAPWMLEGNYCAKSCDRCNVKPQTVPKGDGKKPGSKSGADQAKSPEDQEGDIDLDTLVNDEDEESYVPETNDHSYVDDCGNSP